MRPSEILTSEYNPYYKRYIDLVGNVDLFDALTEGLKSTEYFFENLPETIWDYQYSEGKWTPKDILQHITDTERVFAYRALYFARSNNAELKGFDENMFAKNAFAANKTVAELLKNYASVRNASLSLFDSFDENQLCQIGNANGSAMSVRAAGFIICGHEIHHRNIINERYL